MPSGGKTSGDKAKVILAGLESTGYTACPRSHTYFTLLALLQALIISRVPSYPHCSCPPHVLSDITPDHVCPIIQSNAVNPVEIDICTVQPANLSNNLDAHRPRRRYHALTQPLQALPRQSQLALLDLGDLVHVLQRHLADRLVPRVHRAPESVLARLHVGRFQEEPGRRRRAQVEGERAIRADGDSRWDGHAGLDVGGARVEFLVRLESSCRNVCIQRTLQKSMLLTPLLPRAGPTGGLGLAWPAPTMSLTI